eukprot:COSAG02_NODE_23890_length_705_cov_0.805281_1_plen_141_part_10
MVSQWILLVAALYCAVVPAVKSQLVYNASTAVELTETMLTVSSESQNIALHRPALQSTLGNGVIDDGSTGWAGRAVDGNTATDWGSGSCTETKLSGGSGSDNPWWRVDLGATYALSSIAISHRSDCCSDRMEGAVIYSSDV